MQHDDDTNVWKGLVAGLAGGLIASWTMNQFQAAWMSVAAKSEKPHGAQSMQPSQGSTGNQAEDGKEQDDERADHGLVLVNPPGMIVPSVRYASNVS